MVLPQHIIEAAQKGDSCVVIQWLDAAPQGSVNAEGQKEGRWAGHPLTLLYWTCIPHLSKEECITAAHVELARLLLARGADPNWRDHLSQTPLHCVCCQTEAGAAADMASLLIEAGTEFVGHGVEVSDDCDDCCETADEALKSEPVVAIS